MQSKEWLNTLELEILVHFADWIAVLLIIFQIYKNNTQSQITAQNP